MNIDNLRLFFYENLSIWMQDLLGGDQLAVTVVRWAYKILHGCKSGIYTCV